MKRLFFILLFVLISSVCLAQTYPVEFNADHDTAKTKSTLGIKMPWYKFSNGTMMTTAPIPYTDTLSWLYTKTRIDSLLGLKLNLVDSSGLGYLPFHRLGDSAGVFRLDFRRIDDTTGYGGTPTIAHLINNYQPLGSYYGTGDTTGTLATQNYVTNALIPYWLLSDTILLHNLRQWVADQSYLTTEADPVWIGDSSGYYKKGAVDFLLSGKQAAGTYLIPDDSTLFRDKSDLTYIPKSDSITGIGYERRTRTDSIAASLTSIMGDSLANKVNLVDSTWKYATRYDLTLYPLTSSLRMGAFLSDTGKFVLTGDSATGIRYGTKYDLSLKADTAGNALRSWVIQYYAPLISPSFTTPNIGAATGTSLALGGATLDSSLTALGIHGRSLKVNGGDIYLRETDDGNEAVTLHASTTIGTISVFQGGGRKIYFSGGSENNYLNNDGNFGLGTTTPLHRFTTISSASKGLNAYNFVNSDINKILTTVAEATDSSSNNLRFSGTGEPFWSLVGKAGNLQMYSDSAKTIIGTPLTLGITAGTGTLAMYAGSYYTGTTLGYLSSGWGEKSATIGTVGSTALYTRTKTINGTTVTVVTTD